MAITAINAVVADVMLVAELDGLLPFDPLSGVPSRTSDLCRDPKGCEQNKNGAVNRGPRQIVRAMTENLWHRRRLEILRLRTDLCADNQRGQAIAKRFRENCTQYLAGAITLTTCTDFFKLRHE